MDRLIENFFNQFESDHDNSGLSQTVEENSSDYIDELDEFLTQASWTGDQQDDCQLPVSNQSSTNILKQGSSSLFIPSPSSLSSHAAAPSIGDQLGLKVTAQARLVLTPPLQYQDKDKIKPGAKGLQAHSELFHGDGSQKNSFHQVLHSATSDNGSLPGLQKTPSFPQGFKLTPIDPNKLTEQDWDQSESKLSFSSLKEQLLHGTNQSRDTPFSKLISLDRRESAETRMQHQDFSDKISQDPKSIETACNSLLSPCHPNLNPATREVSLNTQKEIKRKHETDMIQTPLEQNQIKIEPTEVGAKNQNIDMSKVIDLLGVLQPCLPPPPKRKCKVNYSGKRLVSKPSAVAQQQTISSGNSASIFLQPNLLHKATNQQPDSDSGVESVGSLSPQDITSSPINSPIENESSNIRLNPRNGSESQMLKPPSHIQASFKTSSSNSSPLLTSLLNMPPSSSPAIEIYKSFNFGQKQRQENVFKASSNLAKSSSNQDLKVETNAQLSKFYNHIQSPSEHANSSRSESLLLQEISTHKMIALKSDEIASEPNKFKESNSPLPSYNEYFVELCSQQNNTKKYVSTKTIENKCDDIIKSLTSGKRIWKSDGDKMSSSNLNNDNFKEFDESGNHEDTTTVDVKFSESQLTSLYEQFLKQTSSKADTQIGSDIPTLGDESSPTNPIPKPIEINLAASGNGQSKTSIESLTLKEEEQNSNASQYQQSLSDFIFNPPNFKSEYKLPESENQKVEEELDRSHKEECTKESSGFPQIGKFTFLTQTISNGNIINGYQIEQQISHENNNDTNGTPNIRIIINPIQGIAPSTSSFGFTHLPTNTITSQKDFPTSNEIEYGLNPKLNTSISLVSVPNNQHSTNIQSKDSSKLFDQEIMQGKNEISNQNETATTQESNLNNLIQNTGPRLIILNGSKGSKSTLQKILEENSIGVNSNELKTSSSRVEYNLNTLIKHNIEVNNSCPRINLESFMRDVVETSDESEVLVRSLLEDPEHSLTLEFDQDHQQQFEKLVETKSTSRTKDMPLLDGEFDFALSSANIKVVPEWDTDLNLRLEQLNSVLEGHNNSNRQFQQEQMSANYDPNKW